MKSAADGRAVTPRRRPACVAGRVRRELSHPEQATQPVHRRHHVQVEVGVHATGDSLSQVYDRLCHPLSPLWKGWHALYFECGAGGIALVVQGGPPHPRAARATVLPARSADRYEDRLAVSRFSGQAGQARLTVVPRADGVVDHQEHNQSLLLYSLPSMRPRGKVGCEHSASAVFPIMVRRAPGGSARLGDPGRPSVEPDRETGRAPVGGGTAAGGREGEARRLGRTETMTTTPPPFPPPSPVLAPPLAVTEAFPWTKDAGDEAPVTADPRPLRAKA